jgi:hypothetical protein
MAFRRVGTGHRRALVKGPDATPTFWSLSTSSPSGSEYAASQISGRNRR